MGNRTSTIKTRNLLGGSISTDHVVYDPNDNSQLVLSNISNIQRFTFAVGSWNLISFIIDTTKQPFKHYLEA